MTSRERVQAVLAHRIPDRVPLDLGSCSVTGMHVSAVSALRQAMQLSGPEARVKVIDPYQMLGEVEIDLRIALGVDTVALLGRTNKLGFENGGWKPWTTFQGTPVLVPGGFNTEPNADGDLLQYPEGDTTAPPSGHMPKGGWYSDNIVRQPPIDEATLDPEDNVEEFGLVPEADLAHYAAESKRLFEGTDKALVANFGGTGFGDISSVPAPKLKHPKGIRDISEWYMSLLARRDYVYRVFERQCEIALANLERIHAVVGERVSVALITGTDFGTQRGPFLSTEAYLDLFYPFHVIVNEWVHTHTQWKTMIHTDGSILELIPHFIKAGFDVLNPIQWTAMNMDPAMLKREFGKDLVFWGGGVDTQRTLPFGTPEEIREEVKRLIEVLSEEGGYVFTTVHNVQGDTPVENLLALYKAFHEYACYG